MDKKDFNEKLENGLTPEENVSSVNSPEAADAPVETVSEEPVQAAVESSSTPQAPRTQESVPVMNKLGGGTPPPTPAAPGSGKGWMIASIVLAAALIVVLIVQPFKKDDSKTAVATVNGTDITKAQLYDKLIQAGGKATLQNLITTTLVNQEAKKANITITDEDINKEVQDLTAQFGGEEGLNNALQQSSMTLEDLKAQMPLQVQIRRLVEPQVKVTDEDITKFFNENKASFNQEAEVHAAHILVKTKEEADAIVKQLKDGADFAALAKEKSADAGSKENGGDLNFFKRGDMVAEFSDAAFNLKVGETSGAVKSEYGYHIIKVIDRKEAHEYTLDEKKEEIRKTLTSQKVSEKSSTWLQDLTTKATITNTLTDEPKASATPAASEEPAATATEAPAK